MTTLDPIDTQQTQTVETDENLKQLVDALEIQPSNHGDKTPDVTLETEVSDTGAGLRTGSDLSPRSRSSSQQAYHVKWIRWKGNSTPIITQNENGPCPLIAIMNVLLLRGTVHIPQMVEIVSASQLVGYLGDCLLTRSLENASEGVQRNHEQNIHDAMEIITKLSTGIDVNVKFTGIKDFEYTQECVVFDLLNIVLCHGWLYDPQNAEIVSAIGTSSYNQAVENIIANKSSMNEEEQHRGLVAEQFLENTAAQLTHYGLCELNETIDDGELCVFFRNNHFTTLHRHKNELFVLVTDQGFLTESDIVWESLSSVEGDSRFVDGEFNSRSLLSIQRPAGVLDNMFPEQQLDADRELALQLQEQEDLQLAQNLAQEEEQARQQVAPVGPDGAPAPQPGPTPAAPNQSTKEKSCTLL